MRLKKTGVIAALLALLLATGTAITLSTTASAAAGPAPSCAQFWWTNPYLGFPTLIPTANLSYGSSGPCVKILQQDLNFVINARLRVDGQFGPKTLTAVETFQGKELACTGGVDGIAGHHTMSCLVAGSG
ncbi:MAG TPA: peptidoglycan-binding protein [Streptosporangiaceae bacterium]|nr:peptidoglycan-binding protein [Streptosporangiaceae bacterium]